MKLVWAGDPVLFYPVEKAAVKSGTFAVTVNGQPLFVQSYKDVHYLRFAHEKKVHITVKSLVPASNWELSPQKQSAANGDEFSFELNQPGFYVVQLNHKDRLFILTDKLIKSETHKNRINVLTYKPDNSGTNICTAALQQAINEAAAKKRTLYFPAGTYLTGSLSLPDNSDIYLEAGALIKGSADPRDYPVDQGRREADQVHDKEHYTDNGEWMTFSRLIFINNARHVRLCGKGIIDGNGALLRPQGKPANLIRIRNSEDVHIEGLMLRDPACWNTHILYSNHVTIRNVKLINDRDVANTDGFDPDASQNVLIDHCFAYCSDDNVAVKTTNNSGLVMDCDSIIVQNCFFLTKKSALKLGTETKGKTMQNICFRDNYVMEADRGIVLYCYDGASFQHISFINNYFEKGYADSQKKAIHFQIKNRSGAGEIRDVLIQDCRFSAKFHANIDMSGLDEIHSINGVRFRNLSMGDKLVLNAADVKLNTNQYVYALSFEK